MVMYAKIRRMFYREHLSISEIARRTSLTRNTIKKWLKAADDSEPKYLRTTKLTKLTPFEPQLILALTADAHRPKRDRRTALMLFTDIKQQGFTGCYALVKESTHHMDLCFVLVLSITELTTHSYLRMVRMHQWH